jgi:hypothetical protein
VWGLRHLILITAERVKPHKPSWLVGALTEIVGGALMLWGVTVIPATSLIGSFAGLVLFGTGIWALAVGLRALARRGG